VSAIPGLRAGSGPGLRGRCRRRPGESCPAPCLMEALIPRKDESHGSTDEVSRGASGASDPDGGQICGVIRRRGPALCVVSVSCCDPPAGLWAFGDATGSVAAAKGFFVTERSYSGDRRPLLPSGSG